MSRSREKLYYSISEVAEIVEVKPHVLRYWETQFKFLKPRKNRAGNRMYRPRDLNLVLTIRDLLYRNGYTTAGARRKLLDARRRGELEDGLLTNDAHEPDVDTPAPRSAAMNVPSDSVDQTLPAAAKRPPADRDGEGETRDDAQLTLEEAARVRHLRDVRRELEALLSVLDTPGGHIAH